VRDGLRGLAAMAVVLRHFYPQHGLFPPYPASTPTPLFILFHQGYLRVQVFFVLSGFVIAYSLRSAYVTPSYMARFAFRRSLRLDPPYWIALAIVISSICLPRLVLHKNPAMPFTISGVLAHMFYLQDLVGMPNMLGLSWTLCLELQFYLCFAVMLGISQRIADTKIPLISKPTMALALVFLPLFLVSLLVRIDWLAWPVPGVFVPYWCEFFAGVLCCWCLLGAISGWWFGVFAITITLALCKAWQPTLVTVLATACLILFAGRRNKMSSWLNVAPIQYLGRISYSLYLMHGAVAGFFLILVFKLIPDAGRFALLWMPIAILISLCAAHLMYVCVERPSLELSRRLKVQAGSIDPRSLTGSPRSLNNR
jgi:peptidoglycan/LPS O-acetylase OafA/YrhL